MEGLKAPGNDSGVRLGLQRQKGKSGSRLAAGRAGLSAQALSVSGQFPDTVLNTWTKSTQGDHHGNDDGTGTLEQVGDAVLLAIPSGLLAELQLKAGAEVRLSVDADA